MPDTDRVVTIDCHYLQPQCVAAYLIDAGDASAFVDASTVHAVPHLLAALSARGLRPEQVAYIIITHVHLDHCGGTVALLEQCPNATVIAHPRAARHLIRPERLVASVKQVYGAEAFAKLYGELEPADPDRVRSVDDGETIACQDRALTFLHTRGHANHHICIHDTASNGVFTGDTFGIAYPALHRDTRPFITCTSAPTDFDAAEARHSVQRILDTGATTAYLTHYGPLHDVPQAATDLGRSLDDMEAILEAALATDAEGEALEAFCKERVRLAQETQVRACGFEPDAQAQPWLEPDIRMNARGLAFVAQRRRGKQ